MMNLCLRCGYEWPQRYDHTPRACPACKSYRWNVSRSDAPVVSSIEKEKPTPNKVPPGTSIGIGNYQPKLAPCSTCGKSYLEPLVENQTCIWCRPVMLSKCVKCGRTTGKNLQDKETGLCPTCKDGDK
jgi:DNA-directed RNA polymerase subunit RPC12/RpoP